MKSIGTMIREAALSSQVHFLEQSVQKLDEELENQKKLNVQFVDRQRLFTTIINNPTRLANGEGYVCRIFNFDIHDVDYVSLRPSFRIHSTLMC
ncbi:unnamed protein product [Eruca vesicaria subsp. sativa]|uniref:Uncharacterized protein n=1 Tax=Eruca vesicaria subsp. sativa TaxID=29727 RepID=A0ABC8JXA3_ERUVS|nr:unnamed protein product [Eruca vesicaria subsp. sativa]